MAVPTNTVQTTAAIGNREDLADAIYQISPEQTPLLSMLTHNSATAIRHDWQLDNLETAASNIQIEGDDATANTFNPTTRLNNFTQISRKVISVSRTQRRVNTAGRADEFSYQVSQKGAELKLDMEFALARNQASSAGGAATGRASAGIESWLSTNKTAIGAGGAATTPGFSGTTVVAPTDDTLTGVLTKASIDDIVQQCWTAGGNPTEIMAGASNRALISGFTGISTLQTPAGAGSAITMIGAIDFYKSNFGTLRVSPSRIQRARTVLILDKEYFAVSFIDNMKVTDLAKTGDNDKSMLVSEYCLESRNQAASGKITDTDGT